MSDWGQGFPRDPPGMLPIPHLSREEDRVVGERYRTKGRCPDFGAVKRPLYPKPPPQERPGPCWADSILIKAGFRFLQQVKGAFHSVLGVLQSYLKTSLLISFIFTLGKLRHREGKRFTEAQ